MVMTAAPMHHPDSELLLARAAGSLDPAVKLAVSAHLDLCPRCARRAAVMDFVGGIVLEEIPPADLSPDALEQTLNLLDRPEMPAKRRESTISERLRALGLEHIPPSLRPLTARAAESRGWKRQPGGIREFLLRKEPQGTELRFLLIPPGSGVPRHTHAGMEVSLVVKGAFRDETGFYRAGDLAVASEELTHRPIAAPGEPCLAFTVTRAPIRFTGALGLVQRALGPA